MIFPSEKIIKERVEEQGKIVSIREKELRLLEKATTNAFRTREKWITQQKKMSLNLSKECQAEFDKISDELHDILALRDLAQADLHIEELRLKYLQARAKSASFYGAEAELGQLKDFWEGRFPCRNHKLRAQAIVEGILMSSDPLGLIKKEKEKSAKAYKTGNFEYPNDSVYTKIADKVCRVFKTDVSDKTNEDAIAKSLHNCFDVRNPAGCTSIQKSTVQVAIRVVAILNLIWPY